MRRSLRGTWLVLTFWAACLVLGWLIAELYVAAVRPLVAIVRFEGLIDTASAGQMFRILEAARTDQRIAALVLELDSYGGDARSSEGLYHVLLRLRQEKPLVVVVVGAATSGGYHMAVAGNKIYAPAVSEIGNVGARSGRPWDPSISPDWLSTGPFKLDGGSRFDNIRQLDLVKEAFVSHVVYQRSLSPYNPLRVDAKTLAEAHVYMGSEALALGLIDAPGGLSDAIQAAAELAGLDSYRTVQLLDYLGMSFTPSSYYSVPQLVRSALPGTVFLLDSRIALGDVPSVFTSRNALPWDRPTGGRR